MDDLISRQWLMECVNEGWIKFDTEKDENRFIHLVRDIAPSAQPEERTNKRTETHACDCISRKAAIDELDKGAWGVEWDKTLAKTMIESLPSAQPTQNTRVNSNNSLDTISREAAIDAIDEINAEVEDGYGFDYAKWRVHFRVLPSAQPEQQWIPCSKRLPFDAGYYLTTTTYNEVFCDYWNLNEWNRTEQVIAWMHLPEPYSERRQE